MFAGLGLWARLEMTAVLQVVAEAVGVSKLVRAKTIGLVWTLSALHPPTKNCCTIPATSGVMIYV